MENIRKKGVTTSFCTFAVAAVPLFTILGLVLFYYASSSSSTQRLEDLMGSFAEQDEKLAAQPETITSLGRQQHKRKVDGTVSNHITCDRCHFRYDICFIKSPTVLHPKTATFIFTAPHNITEKIKPYPRKWESSTVMKNIREINLVSMGEQTAVNTQCEVQHDAPAIMFNAGGYTGNFFHDFNDGFLPLFITVHSLSLADKEFTIVIDKLKTWWLLKYTDLLQGFTPHPIVDLAHDNRTHCFSSAIIGLISHGFMTINPHLISPEISLNLTHFQHFLQRVYNRKLLLPPSPPRRPLRLVWLTRGGGARGRAIVNLAETKRVMEEIGFMVTFHEPKLGESMRDLYQLISQCQVMVGIHGAALTHFLFLRPGSVFLQVVPVGLDGVSDLCFGKPARELGIEYMEYRVTPEESTLVDKYGKDDPILRNPREVIRGRNWTVMEVYLKEQDVSLDLSRFGRFMGKVYSKAKGLTN